MTGKLVSKSGVCALCGGSLEADQRATVPFVLGKAVVVVKDVPAQVCRDCGEPYLSHTVSDQLAEWLERFSQLPMEVSVTSYLDLVTAENRPGAKTG